MKREYRLWIGLKFEDVWGIGPQHAKRLYAIGVKTVFDFTQLNDGWIKKNMAIVGVRLQKELEGIETVGHEEKAPTKRLPLWGHLIEATATLKTSKNE